MVADTIAHTVEAGAVQIGKPGAAALGGRITTRSAAETTPADHAVPSAAASAGAVQPGRIVILFGTESGNAEMVAEELAADVQSQREAVVHDMTDYDVTTMTADEFCVIVCSTHCDG